MPSVAETFLFTGHGHLSATAPPRWRALGILTLLVRDQWYLGIHGDVTITVPVILLSYLFIFGREPRGNNDEYVTVKERPTFFCLPVQFY